MSTLLAFSLVTISAVERSSNASLLFALTRSPILVAGEPRCPLKTTAPAAFAPEELPHARVAQPAWPAHPCILRRELGCAAIAEPLRLGVQPAQRLPIGCHGCEGTALLANARGPIGSVLPYDVLTPERPGAPKARHALTAEPGLFPQHLVSEGAPVEEVETTIVLKIS